MLYLNALHSDFISGSKDPRQYLPLCSLLNLSRSALLQRAWACLRKHHRIPHSDPGCSLHLQLHVCVTPRGCLNHKCVCFFLSLYFVWVCMSCVCLLVVTSLIISAEAWHPLTMCLVHVDRSLVVSARNRWASMPSRVPVRVAKNSSVPEWGDPRSGPECTRLDEHIDKGHIV